MKKVRIFFKSAISIVLALVILLALESPIMSAIASGIESLAQPEVSISEEEITQRLVKLCSSMNENSKFTNLVNKLKDKGFSEKDAVFIIENLKVTKLPYEYLTTARTLLTKIF